MSRILDNYANVCGHYRAVACFRLNRHWIYYNPCAPRDASHPADRPGVTQTLERCFDSVQRTAYRNFQSSSYLSAAPSFVLGSTKFETVREPRKRQAMRQVIPAIVEQPVHGEVSESLKAAWKSKP